MELNFRLDLTVEVLSYRIVSYSVQLFDAGRLKTRESEESFTKVMTPMRSSSLLGLRGTLRGVELPELGGEPPSEDPAHREGGMELMERKRPPRLSPLPTRHSISSARIAVFSFSSWIILPGSEGEVIITIQSRFCIILYIEHPIDAL